MPTIEVDEATLAAFPEMQRIWGVAQRIASEPKARELMQEAVLIAAPDAAGPEARIRKEAKDRESVRDKKLDDFLAAQAEKENREKSDEAKRSLESQWLESRSAARKAGYDGEALENLEKFMEQKGVLDHEVAISHFEKLHPPPPPSLSSGTRWNFFDAQTAEQPDMKLLFEQNYDGYLDQAIPASLRDVRGG